MRELFQWRCTFMRNLIYKDLQPRFFSQNSSLYRITCEFSMPFEVCNFTPFLFHNFFLSNLYLLMIEIKENGRPLYTRALEQESDETLFVLLIFFTNFFYLPSNSNSLIFWRKLRLGFDYLSFIQNQEKNKQFFTLLSFSLENILSKDSK